MKLSDFLIVLAVATSCNATARIHRYETAVEHELPATLTARKRASPEAPDGYIPSSVTCPSTRPTLVSAAALTPEESQWLTKRRPNTIPSMQDFLGRMNITNFDTTAYLNTHSSNISALPNIGIAASGGGWRALMNGAGALAAFDNRTPNATASGQLGGLLQSTTYLSGLSGGSWLVGSIYTNNFSSVQNILDQHGELWDFSQSILEGPSGHFQALDTVDYYTHLYNVVEGKHDAGFNVSLTDYWGRALSYQMVNASAGGEAYTFSSIADDAEFSAGNTPMPILVSDERAPGQILVPANTTIYEFSPFHLGSWDPTVFGFAPLRYLGSNFTGGVLPDNKSCVAGYDNVGFVMGTSSTLFNAIVLDFNQTVSLPSILEASIQDILNDLGDDSNDIADYNPNPFYLFNPDTNSNANSERLTLVDGGEDLQNIPLHPLIQPVREVDVIFAIDSSADTTDNWPNGTSLVATYERSLNAAQQNGTQFPSIPGQDTFVNLGLNTRPTFFGCNASNSTNAGNSNTPPSPLIVYLPNSPYVTYSNVSTFTFSYNNTYRDAIIQNGYDVATRANGTGDAQWPTCVGCAVLLRSLERTGTTIPDVCNQCLSRYCWDGTVNNTAPAPYVPVLGLNSTGTSGAQALVPGLRMLAAAALAAVAYVAV